MVHVMGNKGSLVDGCVEKTQQSTQDLIATLKNPLFNPEAGENMTKVLVAYMTSTGNTKKIAEAIYGEITAEKEIKPIKEVQDIGGYDLTFLGFPTHGYGPDKKTKKILEEHCTKGRKVALFVTHGAPEDEPEVPEWMAKFKQAAAEAEIVGFFDCQGQLAKSAKFVMTISPNKKMRADAKKDNSLGQPDKTRLDKARSFARETMSQLG
jgi:flavodoxin